MTEQIVMNIDRAIFCPFCHMEYVVLVPIYKEKDIDKNTFSALIEQLPPHCPYCAKKIRD